MFEFFKLKTPREYAEYNKQKIINKNVKKIVKDYTKFINNMIKNGITYENHVAESLIIGNFKKEIIDKAYLELKKKWHFYGIVFKITYTGCDNSYIGISIEFI